MQPAYWRRAILPKTFANLLSRRTLSPARRAGTGPKSGPLARALGDGYLTIAGRRFLGLQVLGGHDAHDFFDTRLALRDLEHRRVPDLDQALLDRLAADGPGRGTLVDE